MKIKRTQLFIMDEIDKLHVILKKGYWIQVSPMASADPEEWILAIYKKGKKSWVTDICQSGFSNPKKAYDWAFKKIEEERI